MQIISNNYKLKKTKRENAFFEMAVETNYAAKS